MMASCSSPPVPSFALQITQSDAERFLEASRALESSLEDLQQQRLRQQQEKEEEDAAAKTAEENPRCVGKEEGEQFRADSTSAADGAGQPPPSPALLHETLHEAAQRCRHPYIVSVLDRLSSAGLTLPEVQAGLLLFHDTDKTDKLRHLFRIFSSPDRDAGAGADAIAAGTTGALCLDSQGAASLFRSVLTALSCCVPPERPPSTRNRNHPTVIVEGQPPSPEEGDGARATKRAKRESDHDDDDGNDTLTTRQLTVHSDATTASCADGGAAAAVRHQQGECEDDSSFHNVDDIDVSRPATSFDSSLASSAAASPPDDGRSHRARRELQEIATCAAEELVRYKRGSDNTAAATAGAADEDEPALIDFKTFGDWYNSAGNSVVRWIELLQLSKWRKLSSVAAQTSPNVPRKPKQLRQQQQQPPPQLQQPSPPQQQQPPDSPGSLHGEEDTSPSLISFDFSSGGGGSSSGGNNHTNNALAESALCINISEDNLHALKALVSRTGLGHCPAADVCKTLLRLARRKTLPPPHSGAPAGTALALTRDEFTRTAIPRLVPNLAQLSHPERGCVYQSLLDFFWLYQSDSGRQQQQGLGEDEVDLKELAVGICFFCAGNKSTKLATGFELLDEQGRGHLSEEQLLGYLRSYLLALVALSFLVPQSKQQQRRVVSSRRRSAIRAAIESGAKWTLGHFLNYLGHSSDPNHNTNNKCGDLSFESFAHWYSTGGYNIAPWLELLALDKVFSLINETSSSSSNSPIPLPTFPQSTLQTTARRPAPPRDRISSLRRHHSSRGSGGSGGNGIRGQHGPPPEILFSFPLASGRSLVVLKEDAKYVREVVEFLGLLSMTPDNLWSLLTKTVHKRRKKSQKNEVAVYVKSATFVECMQEVCSPPPPAARAAGRKRSSPGSSPSSAMQHQQHSIPELLSNFFQCFDISQVDSVALDELMGGLTLLCGGKKSMKLAFAFGIFDTRPEVHNNKSKKKKDDVVNSLSGEDLFLFLRSILIVTFSCCRQSLDMTDDSVSRCIADTANMICNDVMRHQWETKQADRLNFDEFGQWYNEGGFERAPWLELLSLEKWALVDDMEAVQKRDPGDSVTGGVHDPSSAVPVPPPPPEDALDPSFFDEGIMPMDSMDEMDMMLMPQPSSEREVDADGLRLQKSFSFSSPRQHRSQEPDPGPPALKFHLTFEQQGGFMLSFSRARIDHLRRILEESGIISVTVEDACNAILSKSSRTGKANAEPKITREGFDSAVKSIVSWRPGTSRESKRSHAQLMGSIFSAFDCEGTGRPSVILVACGMTVLCKGKKSEKLEFAFETLDKHKRGYLSKKDLTRYLQSFLTVLLSVAFSPALAQDPAHDTLTTLDGESQDKSAATLNQAILQGAGFAASLAFREIEGSASISFDDFADWYTAKGFSSIPWLELLSLDKWLTIGRTE